MKIQAVDIITLKAQPTAGQTPVLARIRTDEGVYGYGEAGVSIMHYSLGCVELLKSFSQMILGMDALANDVVYTKLLNSFWARGNGGVILAAVSAIDTALWDIKGKYFGVPVCQLLGGKHRDKLRCYASQLQNGWKYPDFHGAPGDLGFLKEACRRAVEDDGYDCVKIDFLAKHPDSSRISDYEAQTHLSPATMREIDQKLDAVRSVIGPDVELILENHCLTTAQTAIQFGRLARDYDPMLLEEPANPLDIHDYQRIREALDIPIATGERSYTRRGFLPLLQAGVVDTVQPDLGNCGGITEGRKIADLAESLGATVQTHTCNTPISIAAALQLEAAIPNFIIHEHHTNNTLPFNTGLCVYDDQPVDGWYTVPDRPGLGNELTEQALAEASILTVR
ncbi:mandelate racemase/muconate lactonizing enzyme family protein [Pseudoflavonifractor sp. MSJ-37]|uniref:mandelate racemase/muconate lactonizing enzyme family protein n=1 Tax=Pseudoflavonifractor sp. MSJ-37 TaxID=2841531 RepID=UPI001C114AA7|nr:mandelate racemase/muconate lactonizing enzyme family protein [Pseudoflavonifractor sp. MSJ-37]MBU5435458.1 mandelate racemase/muconate lactonizing enzyme family protein [Pseudoflavonifractor sp. MSJ-37]